MPKPGYTSYTFKDEDVADLLQDYQNHEDHWRRRGIHSFPAYLKFRAYQGLERERGKTPPATCYCA